MQVLATMYPDYVQCRKQVSICMGYEVRRWVTDDMITENVFLTLFLHKNVCIHVSKYVCWSMSSAPGIGDGKRMVKIRPGC